ncbi:hypothetical protein GCM10012275_08010 [Longimycelium tulufanense]|uniref:Head-tail adaptor protein n=1 Tax=Longimycelium tulufanense TaxID=907463 RepID=A0A8J3CAL1_9PSEU|nr:hypothetical protein GCM10012275_08010 [Longimycelium tulufanense]
MISHHLLRDVVTVWRPRWATDRYGNRTTSYPRELAAQHPCRLYMTAGREQEKYRETAVTTWFLLLSPEVPIDYHCRVTYKTHSFDVEAVQPRRNWGGVSHLTVRLREVEGWTDGASGDEHGRR